MENDRSADPVAARKNAMDYLARREHGGAELQAKLEKAGFDTDVARNVIARLVADGLQSDERFVEAFIRSRIGKGKGPARIRAELHEHGVNDSLVAAGLRAAGEDWDALALEVRMKKFGSAAPADFRDKARQMRFLQSRGFDAESIQSAVSASPE